jgi:enoyl-CoA hydratase/carnithine racemase
MSVSTGLAIVEVDGPVGILRLNRPEKLNALNAELAMGLADGIEAFEADDAIHVLVIGGSTGRAFSAGADINEQVAQIEAGAESGGAYRRLMAVGGSARKPVVAAIEGYCYGGGLHLAMCCDIRVCSTTATFKHTGVELGVAMGARLTGLIGPVAAKEIVMTADVIDADEALRVGLVSRVVAAGETWTTAIAIARRIAGNDPDAVCAVKRIVDLAAATPQASSLERILQLEFKASRKYSTDFKTGLRTRLDDV